MKSLIDETQPVKLAPEESLRNLLHFFALSGNVALNDMTAKTESVYSRYTCTRSPDSETAYVAISESKHTRTQCNFIQFQPAHRVDRLVPRLLVVG